MSRSKHTEGLMIAPLTQVKVGPSHGRRGVGVWCLEAHVLCAEGEVRGVMDATQTLKAK